MIHGSNISKLALGTVQFGLDYGISNTSGKTDTIEAKKILKRAHQYGIDMLDTANAYGNSELVIGNIGSTGFNIVSKYSANVITKGDLRASLLLSLKNLKTFSLYALLAHDAETILNNPALWQTMKELKNEKLVKKIGYSLYIPEQLEKLLDLNYKPDIVQIPYSFIDRRFEKYFKQLKSIGCEIHVRSVFLQGLFFLEPNKLSSFFDPIKPLLIELRRSFSSHNEIAGFLMNFVLNNPDIDKLVFGVNTENQLIENILNLQVKTDHVTINWNKNIPVDILMPNKWPN